MNFCQVATGKRYADIEKYLRGVFSKSTWKWRTYIEKPFVDISVKDHSRIRGEVQFYGAPVVTESSAKKIIRKSVEEV
jgi:hypothetical protein